MLLVACIHPFLMSAAIRDPAKCEVRLVLAKTNSDAEIRMQISDVCGPNCMTDAKVKSGVVYFAKGERTFTMKTCRLIRLVRLPRKMKPRD